MRNILALQQVHLNIGESLFEGPEEVLLLVLHHSGGPLLNEADLLMDLCVHPLEEKSHLERP